MKKLLLLLPLFLLASCAGKNANVNFIIGSDMLKDALSLVGGQDECNHEPIIKDDINKAGDTDKDKASEELLEIEVTEMFLSAPLALDPDHCNPEADLSNQGPGFATVLSREPDAPIMVLCSLNGESLQDHGNGGDDGGQVFTRYGVPMYDGLLICKDADDQAYTAVVKDGKC